MHMTAPPRHCPACGCEDASAAHALVAALAADDVDRALDLGLLDAHDCAGCAPACRAALWATRDARAQALAARDRFRARQTRLELRREERAARRASAARQPAALPPAAAAALARARARAAKS